MDKKQMLTVVKRYKRFFARRGISRKKFRASKHHSTVETLPHIHALLDDIELLARATMMEEARQLLGFVQGALWMHNIYTISELRRHNRPFDTPF